MDYYNQAITQGLNVRLKTFKQLERKFKVDTLRHWERQTLLEKESKNSGIKNMN